MHVTITDIINLNLKWIASDTLILGGAFFLPISLQRVVPSPKLEPMRSYTVNKNRIGKQDPLVQIARQRSCYFIIRICGTVSTPYISYDDILLLLYKDV